MTLSPGFVSQFRRQVVARHAAGHDHIGQEQINPAIVSSQIRRASTPDEAAKTW